MRDNGKENPSGTPDLDRETMTQMINRSQQINSSSTIYPGGDSSTSDQEDNQGGQGDSSNQHEEEISPQEADNRETGIIEETDRRNNLENREEQGARNEKENGNELHDRR